MRAALIACRTVCAGSQRLIKAQRSQLQKAAGEVPCRFQAHRLPNGAGWSKGDQTARRILAAITLLQHRWPFAPGLRGAVLDAGFRCWRTSLAELSSRIVANSQAGGGKGCWQPLLEESCVHADACCEPKPCCLHARSAARCRAGVGTWRARMARASGRWTASRCQRGGAART